MISVVVPVSPIPSHPATDILEETISSVRFHLPDAELVLTFDGVRDEQHDRVEAYEEHIRRVLWLARSWGAVIPWIFDKHSHQSGMLRKTLPDIADPLLLYVEADTPLVTDEPIDWPGIQHFILSGDSNVVRFNHEAGLLKPHMHLMHGEEGQYVRTSQWSQRPHLASTAYYRRIMDAHFTAEAKAFIEDKMHSVVQEAFNLDGMPGWMQHRIHIYNPGPNMKRSYHLDGRQGAAKYDDSQVW